MDSCVCVSLCVCGIRFRTLLPVVHRFVVPELLPRPGVCTCLFAERTIRAMDSIEAALVAKGSGFVFDPHRGYLTACPSNLGTGMRPSVLLRIPLLASMPSFTEYVGGLGLEVSLSTSFCLCPHYACAMSARIISGASVQVRGANGERDTRRGDVVDLSSKQRLGTTEVQQIQTLLSGVKKLVDIEGKLSRGESIAGS